MRESDILHETPRGFWVCLETRGTFAVYRPSPSRTHSVADSAYEDLSLAIARADYLERYAR